MKLLGALWFLILSDGVAAAIGARAAWRLRDEFDHRPELAVGFSVGLGCYAVARFAGVLNSIFNGPRLVYPERFLVTALIINAFQSVGIWVVALSLLNGAAPRFIQKPLARLLKLLG